MGRTSIPCSDETRDALAEHKPENMTWDAYLVALNEEEKIERKQIQTNSSGAGMGELTEQIKRLRRELDEFKQQVPEDVATKIWSELQ